MKVAGIVTLYNPDNEVKKNIESYLSDLDKLYIIDNTPNKDNKQVIPSSNKIVYLPQDDNVGVATALNIGAKKAINDKYNWLLTMDQDSIFPTKDYPKIYQLIEKYKDTYSLMGLNACN